jgi:hypothetical protein
LDPADYVEGLHVLLCSPTILPAQFPYSRHTWQGPGEEEGGADGGLDAHRVLQALVVADAASDGHADRAHREAEAHDQPGGGEQGPDRGGQGDFP